MKYAPSASAQDGTNRPLQLRCVALRSWQAYEAGQRRMPAATWLLFTLLTGNRTIAYDSPKGRATLRLVVGAKIRPASD